MPEESKKIKPKFIDSDFAKWVGFGASALALVTFVVGAYFIDSRVSSVETKQKNIQLMSATINNGPQSDSGGKVAGVEVVKSEENIPKWDDKREMFDKTSDGYYCIKKRQKHNDQYYFLWNDNPLPSGKRAIVQLSAEKNISTGDSSGKNDSIVIAYADPEKQYPLYEMFFPASEKNIVGFSIDGSQDNGVGAYLIPPKSIRTPFDVYKNKFEIEYGVDFIKDSNEASFSYKLTYMPDDEYATQAVGAGIFTVPMSVNPQNGKPFIFGIGVHRDGPCFKIENYF